MLKKLKNVQKSLGKCNFWAKMRKKTMNNEQ